MFNLLPMARWISSFYFLLVLSPLYPQNILISTEHNPNEPSIILDPLHPNVLIGAANLNNYFISLDTGRTWTVRQLQSTYGVWGDPALAVDTAGDFYFFHLSNPQNGNWIDRIVCQKTTDDGQNWNDGTYTGLQGAKAQDKHWPVVDRRNNMIYLTWTQFDDYGSSLPTDSTIILFSKSADAGLTWSAPKRISTDAGDCIDSDGTVEGAVPAVGPNGEVYVVWVGKNGLMFNMSTDQGETWLDREIPIAAVPGGWDYSIPGIYRANGLPVTVCDLSQGPHRGTLYVNWSDQRNGSSDTDVWLMKSTDGGANWSAPIRVNDDATARQQFFTWMTIDQSTGYLYFVFYDRRNYQTGDSTDVYLAVSTDGGETFINHRISESPFVPNTDIFFGDYTNITAHNGIVRPIWTRLHNGQLSIWTHLTTGAALITTTSHETVDHTKYEFENFPNPSAEWVYVSYKLHTAAEVSLNLVDPNGKVIKRMLNHEHKGYGKYVERMDLQQLHVPPGLYFVQLEINGVLQTQKQVIVSN